MTSWEIGDTVTTTVTSRDAAGALAAVGAMTLTLTSPSAVVTNPAVVSPSLGVHQAQFVANEAGGWATRWLATGAGAGVWRDTIRVAPVIPVILGSDEQREALGITPAQWTPALADQVREHARAATSMIEHLVGPIAPRTITQTVSGDTWVLTTVPVISLQVVTSGGVTQPLTGLTVEPATGVISGIGGANGTVVYVAGRVTPSPGVLQAARVLLQHLWLTQRGSSVRGRGDLDDMPLPGSGTSLPSRVERLLRADWACEIA